MYAWHTPDDEGGSIRCLSLYIRDELIPALYGAMEQLGDETAWEEMGTMTPARAADLCFAAFETLHDGTRCGMIGTLIQYVTVNPPPNVIAGGATYNKDDYPDLYEELPGAWKDATTFTIPDLSDYYYRAAGVSNSVGDVFGNDSITLVTANLPPIDVLTHNHPIPSVDVESPAGVPDVSAGVPSPTTIPVGGSSQSIDIRPKTFIVNVGIVAK